MENLETMLAEQEMVAITSPPKDFKLVVNKVNKKKTLNAICE